MEFDQKLIAAKLRRWERNMGEYSLPDWDSIPDIGLYMVQVIELLQEYFSYLPPDVKDDRFITSAAVNNYVRMKIMPEPVKKRYYRVHIAYLIIIMSLKQSLPIALIKKVIPFDLPQEQVRSCYEKFVHLHKFSVDAFIETVRTSAGRILGRASADAPFEAADTEDLIIAYSVMSGFSRLMSEKLLMLEGRSLREPADEPRKK